MLNRQSVGKTSRTLSTLSSVQDVVGRPKRGLSATSSRPSLNALCQFPDCDLEMQSSLKASCSIWNVSVAFFPASRKTLWRIVVQANAPSRYVTKVENTLQAEARISEHTARTQLTTRCIQRAYPPPHFPAGFTVLPSIVAHHNSILCSLLS
ncbi:hypothetical protein TNCV_117871 [Trichonephila clavipes]|nr:hypothetical protein TNCV_117871 [Trichonephila clavipes]